MIEKGVNKLANVYDKYIKTELEKEFESRKSEIIENILIEYDTRLLVTDRNSKTNPTLYRDDFRDKLDEFEFVKTSGNIVSLVVPDMDNFSFTGRLRVLQTILEGTIGNYVEVNAEDYERMYGKRPTNIQPIDDYVPAKDTFYILRYTSSVQRLERDVLDKKLVRYPFSNTPPIDIFVAANDFVDNNINDWIDAAVDRATDKLSNYRGLE